jgi:hypothetical protein
MMYLLMATSKIIPSGSKSEDKEMQLAYAAFTMEASIHPTK